ncbi:Fic family protein [Aeromonas salmonicida]
MGWIWQQADWPGFHWQDEVLQPRLRSLHRMLGQLLGSSSAIAPNQELDTLVASIMASSAIEGEALNAQSVRASVAKLLGLVEVEHLSTSERTDGLAAMLMDAIGDPQSKLSFERLMQWHRWLFPESDPSSGTINGGQLREDGPMQVVSGRFDQIVVHFEAPPRVGLEQELQQFIEWFNESRFNPILDPLLRAAVCHFWFVTLHPFADGNGRITRVLADLALAQADQQTIRLYAMSLTIFELRDRYYQLLEQTQRGSLDITAWLAWFLDTLGESVRSAITQAQADSYRTAFWQQHQAIRLLPAQRMVLDHLLDGCAQGSNKSVCASQYQKWTGVSKATASRHLADLVTQACLVKLPGGGRNSRYQVATMGLSNLGRSSRIIHGCNSTSGGCTKTVP